MGGIHFHHAHAAGFGEGDEAGNRRRIAAGARGQDEGPTRAGEEPRRLFDARGIGEGARGRVTARRRGDGDRGQPLGQHLARQGDVHGSAGLAQHQLERTIDDRLDLRGMAQLVVPLDVLAQHPRLIERLLGPVYVEVARAGEPLFGEGRPPRGEEDGRASARSADDATRGIGRAHRHVDHDGLRPPRGQVVAVGHAHRHGFVGHHHGTRRHLALGLALGKRVYERGEIRPRIGEEHVHPPVVEELEPGLGHRLDLQRLLSHRVSRAAHEQSARGELTTHA